MLLILAIHIAIVEIEFCIFITRQISDVHPTNKLTRVTIIELNLMIQPVTIIISENKIITISGARNKEFVILEKEFSEISDELIITTDDGSYGKNGFVTDALRSLYEEGRKINRVIAAGPVPMMKLVAEITKLHQTPTVASLNPVMVDGIGMCGGCRVLVGGEIRFACVDGPEFNAHLVDFDSLMRRNTAYREIEQRKEHECKLDAAIREEETDE